MDPPIMVRAQTKEMVIRIEMRGLVEKLKYVVYLLTCVGRVGVRQRQMSKVSRQAAGNPWKLPMDTGK